MPVARAVFYLATAGLFGFALWAGFGSQPSLFGGGLLLLGYVALVVFGVLFSGFGMFANVVTSGPSGARGVALTFDDGPDPESTMQVLDILDDNKVSATFFMIGRKAEKHPALVKEIHQRGHAVGMHSYEHDRLMSLRSPRWIRADLERAIAVLEKITGERPSYFRAPIGHVSPSMALEVRRLGLRLVGWSIRGFDGMPGARPERVVARVRRGLCDGAIVLLHDAAERADFRPASIEALPAILEHAAQHDLPVVRLDSWAKK